MVYRAHVRVYVGCNTLCRKQQLLQFTVLWPGGRRQEKPTMHLYSPKTRPKKTATATQTKNANTDNMPIKPKLFVRLGRGGAYQILCHLICSFITLCDGSVIFFGCCGCRRWRFRPVRILSFSFSFYFSAVRLFLFCRALCLRPVHGSSYCGVFVSREIWPIH